MDGDSSTCDSFEDSSGILDEFPPLSAGGSAFGYGAGLVCDSAFGDCILSVNMILSVVGYMEMLSEPSLY